MNHFLDFLFPKRCVSCGKLGLFLCTKCTTLLIPSLPVCPVCEHTSLYGTTHKRCKTHYSLDGLVSSFTYKGVIKKAIHRYKYRPYIEGLTSQFTQFLTVSIKSNKQLSTFLKTKPVIVSIPLHWYRKQIRGYNQAEKLGLHLSKQLKLEYKDILVRTKYTKPQSDLSRRERQKNIEGVFSVKHRLTTPKHILLIDDVWTTGATIKQAGKLLRENGVKQVWALTLAR